MALNCQPTMLPPLTIAIRRFLSATAFCALLVVAFQPVPAVAQYCQPVTPAAPFPIWGVDSAAGRGCGEVGWGARGMIPGRGCGEVRWDARGMIPWQEFAQGEYVGHARTPHVPEYRVREGDVIAVYYRRTREELSRPYELQVGDRIRVESLKAGHGSTNSPASAGE